MLKITVQGHTIQLPENFSLNLIIENPFMLADRVPTPFTTTFDLPPTPDNLKFFKFPNRVTSTQAYEEYNDCKIFFGPVTIITGVLVVQQYNKGMKAYFRGVIFSDSIEKQLSNLDIPRYSFGPGNRYNPEFDVLDTYAYKYKHLIFSSLSGSQDFVAAPVRLKDVEFPYMPDNKYPDGYGDYAAQQMYFNFINTRTMEYMIRQDGGYDVHTTIFPMPFLHKIFDIIFGDTLEDNVFRTGELAKMVLFTSYHPMFNSSIMSAYQGMLLDNTDAEGAVDNYFKLNSFLPAQPANEFFKDVLKMFCCTLFSVAGKFRIIRNKDIITGSKIENWSYKIIDELTISKQPAQVYQYGYSGANDDSKENPTELNTLSDLVAEPVGGEEKQFKIKSLNQVMSKAKRDKKNESDPDRYVYQVLSTGFGSNQDTSGESFDMSTSISPLPVNLEEYWYQNSAFPRLELNTWAVPVFDGDRMVRPESAQILIYQGLSNTFRAGDRYPLVTPFNVDQFGNKLGALTLAWHGEDGLINREHKEFKAWIESDRVRISGAARLTALDLKNLDLTSKKHINGRLFFIEKLSVTIKKNSIEPAVVDYLEAPGDVVKTYIKVKRVDFTRNNCSVGQTGTKVPYTKTYTSTISQQDADDQAILDAAQFAIEGQANANAIGYCEVPADVFATIFAQPEMGAGGYAVGYAEVTLSGLVAEDISFYCQVQLESSPDSDLLTAFVTVPANSYTGYAYTDLSYMPYNSGIRASGSIVNADPNPAAGVNIRF